MRTKVTIESPLFTAPVTLEDIGGGRWRCELPGLRSVDFAAPSGCAAVVYFYDHVLSNL